MIQDQGLARVPEAAAGVTAKVAEPRRQGRRAFLEPLVSVLSPLLILALWELFVRLKLVDARFFPAPSAVLVTLGQLLASGVLLDHAGASLGRILIGFLIGGIPGLLLGLLMGLSRVVRAAIQPFVGAIYPIPKIAILPLLMLIFGIGEGSKYAVVAVGVFFLVLLNTTAGVMNIEKIYLDVGKNFGASRVDVLRTIALPGALPLILTGIRLAWGNGLLLAVAAEFNAATKGLGYLIWNSSQTFLIEEMFAGLLSISAIGLISFRLLDELEHRVVPWRRERQ